MPTTTPDYHSDDYVSDDFITTGDIYQQTSGPEETVEITEGAPIKVKGIIKNQQQQEAQDITEAEPIRIKGIVKSDPSETLENVDITEGAPIKIKGITKIVGDIEVVQEDFTAGDYVSNDFVTESSHQTTYTENVEIAEGAPIRIKGIVKSDPSETLENVDISETTVTKKVSNIVKVVSSSDLTGDFIQEDYVSHDFNTPTAAAHEPGVFITESTVTTQHKTRVIDEILQTAESIVAKIIAGELPQVEQPRPIGGALLRKIRLRLRKIKAPWRNQRGYQRLFPPPSPVVKPRELERVPLLQQRITEQVPKTLTKVSSSCTCVYSIAEASAPPELDSSSSSHTLETNAIIKRAKESSLFAAAAAAEQHTQQNYAGSKTKPSYPKRLLPAISKQLTAREEPRVLKTLVSKTATISYDTQQKVSNQFTINYDRNILVVIQGPIIKYDRLAAVIVPTITASYNIKKAIAPDHFQKIARLKQLSAVLQIVDSLEEEEEEKTTIRNNISESIINNNKELDEEGDNNNSNHHIRPLNPKEAGKLKQLHAMLQVMDVMEQV